MRGAERGRFSRFNQPPRCRDRCGRCSALGQVLLETGAIANLPAFTWMHQHPSFAILRRPELLRENVVMCDDSIFLSGPHGKQMKLAQLPPYGFNEWQSHHKAMMVTAVRHGLITVDEACRRYNLSTEGYLCWYRCYAPQPSDGRA